MIKCINEGYQRIDKYKTKVPNNQLPYKFSVPNKAFGMSTWVNDKRHTWKEWRYGHSSLAVDGKTDTTLPNCAIMDNYYVESPIWMVDLGKEMNVNGAVVITWQGAGQGNWDCSS